MLQFCTECGAATEPGKKFCTNCGAKLEIPAAASDVTEPVSEHTEPILTTATSIPTYPDPTYPDSSAYVPYYQPAQSETPPIPSYAAQPDTPLVPPYAAQPDAPLVPPYAAQPDAPLVPPYAAQPDASPIPAYAEQPAYKQPGRSRAQTAQADTKPIGMLRYLGYLLVMNIPVVGLIMSIVWGVRKGRAARLARAMIVINVIWYAVVTYGAIIWYEALKQYHISFSIFGLNITIS